MRGSPTAFDDLLPVGTVVVEATPEMWEGGLLPEERAYVERAVGKRVREFTAGRNCARRALAALGISAMPIPSGPGRAPVFPSGIAGSITHTEGYCAAAVTRIGTVLSLGIDVEPMTPLALDVLERIALPAERTQLGSIGGIDAAHWGKALFSMKEAFFKAFFPLAQHYLDFHQALVTIDAAAGAFQVRVLAPAVPAYFLGRAISGRFRYDAHRVFTAVALPAEPALARV